jgi:hypothetical protein
MVRAIRPREALLAELAQHARELVLAHAPQVLGGGLARALVHAHVERPRPLEGKAPLRTIELRRGDAEVDQAAVERQPARLLEHAADARERGVHEAHALAELREITASFLERTLVAIDAPEPPVGRARLQHGAGVSSIADRSVAVTSAGDGREQFDRFLQ